MDGGGLKASFGAGQWRVEFATTNPCRSRETCAPSPFLNLQLFTPCSHCGETRSLCPSCSSRVVELPSPVPSIERPASQPRTALSSRHAADCNCGSDFSCRIPRVIERAFHSSRGRFSHVVCARHQVSMQAMMTVNESAVHDCRQICCHWSPRSVPLRDRSRALGLPEGVLATRKQSALESAAPRVSEFRRPRAADLACWHDFQSAALPSVRRRPPDLPPAVFGSAPASAACLETVSRGICGGPPFAAAPVAFVAAEEERRHPRQTRHAPRGSVRAAKKAEQNQRTTRA